MGLRENIVKSLGGEMITSGKTRKGMATNAKVSGSPQHQADGFSARPRYDASTSRLIDNTSLSRDEIYQGIVYRALTTIANRTAQVLLHNTILKGKNNEEVADLTKHPYWKVLDESKTFTNFEFFYAMATYLQLGGFAPILAVRNFRQTGSRVTSVGDISEFQIISPYNIKFLLDDDDDSLIGYEETITKHNGQPMTRNLGVPHVIPIKLFNPFDNLLGFGVAQAANDFQYTARAAGKYTRRAMRNNISASGILTINKMLDATAKENFKNEMKTRYASEAADGSPILAFGADAMNWQDLRQDMDKMALEKIHDMNTEDLLTVLGVSKTVMGIEQSGVTRETSKVQQDLLMLNIVMPLAQAILDEFNQDYRNYYPNQFANTKFRFELDSPVSKDYEAEKTEAETLSVKLDVAKKMYQFGATRETIVEALELPEELEFDREPAVGGGADTQSPLDELAGAGATGTDLGTEQPTEAPTDTSKHAKEHIHTHEIDELNADIPISEVPTAKNAITYEQVVAIKKLREETLNRIADNESKVIQGYVDAIGEEVEKNALLPADQADEYKKELEAILNDYYLLVVPILGQSVADFRRRQYGLLTEFEVNNDIRQLIRRRVSKTSAAHFDYIDNMMTNILYQAYDEGWGREKVTKIIQETFNDKITKADARRLAVTETNNAFNKSQFWADQQFLAQNDLEGKAFKQWVTYSPNPCPHCLALAAAPPIPFNKPFVAVGDQFGAEFEKSDGTKTVRYLTPNEDFGPIEDGNAHPNCGCKYRLVIKFNA